MAVRAVLAPVAFALVVATAAGGQHPFSTVLDWKAANPDGAGPLPGLKLSSPCLASLEDLLGVKHRRGLRKGGGGGGGGIAQLFNGYAPLYAEANSKFAFGGGSLNFDDGEYDPGDFTTCVNIPRPAATYSSVHVKLPPKAPAALEDGRESWPEVQPVDNRIRLPGGLHIDLARPLGGIYKVGPNLGRARGPGQGGNVGRIGVCLPATCSVADVRAWSKVWMQLVIGVQCTDCKEPLLHKNCTCPEVQYVETILKSHPVDMAGTKLAAALTVVLIMMCAIGTAIGMYTRHKAEAAAEAAATNSLPTTGSKGGGIQGGPASPASLQRPLLVSDIPLPATDIRSGSGALQCVSKVFTAFDAVHNVRRRARGSVVWRHAARSRIR